MSHLGETIDDDEDGVVAGWRWWQRDNEIHGDRGPGLLGNRKWSEESVGLVTRRFDSGARIASGDVAIDEVSEARPMEVTGDDFKRLVLAKVSGRSGIMALVEDFKLDRIIGGNVDEAVE